MHELTAEIGPGEHVLIEGKTPIAHKLILAVAASRGQAPEVMLPAGEDLHCH